jgi:L-fuculose-phosphate aldolase
LFICAARNSVAPPLDVAYRLRMSALSEDAARAQIIEVCRDLHARNLLAAADGNVSIRLAPDCILITPSGRVKARLQPADLAVIDADGRTLAGSPSSEGIMHLEVYRRCPAATCVVHAHPPTAVAWTVARPELTQLPLDCMSEVIIGVGAVPIVPYARPGTPALATQLAAYLPQNRVMVLARHGALSWGETPEEAYAGMERIEHAAHILHLAATLGGLTPLPADEVRALREIRARLGDKSR